MKVHLDISIDQDVKRELSLRHIKNVSGLINDLLKSYLQIKDKDLDSQKQELLNEYNKKSAELGKIEQQLSSIQKIEQAEADKIQKQIENGEIMYID